MDRKRMADKEVLVSSTSDDQPSVQFAADAELEDAAGRRAVEEAREIEQPAEPEGEGPVTLASTTDDKKAAQEALGDSRPSKSGVQRRIDKLTARAKEAERRAAELEQQIRSGQFPQKETTQAEPKPTPSREEPPHLAAHRERVERARQNYPDFDQAIAAADRAGVNLPQAVVDVIATLPDSAELVYGLAKNVESAKWLGSLPPQEAVAVIRNVAHEVSPEYQSAYKKACAEHGQDVVDAGRRMPLSAGLQSAIAELPNATEVAKFLVKNQDAYRRMMSKPTEAAAIAEAGRIAGQLDGHHQAPASRAPAPIRPVGGSSTRSSVPLEEMDFQDYKRERERQERDRYRR